MNEETEAPPETTPSPSTPRLDAGDTVIRQCRWGTMMYSRFDNVIGRALSLYGEFAEDENTLMGGLVAPGDTVIDAGANVGTVTLFLAQTVGAEGRVYAFEPQLEIFHYLCGNVALGGHKNIIALNAALGGAAGSITVPPMDYGHKGNFGAVSLKDMGEGETDVRTIDGLDLADCRLIKIDVEGMEPEVLKGARETINRLKPFVYTENKKNEGSPKVIEFFLERDYALYWHFAHFFREGNFNNVDTNVFEDSGDINMLCVPLGAPMSVDLPPVTGPDADWQVDYPAWLKDR